MTQKFLILGGRGFLGSRVHKHLSALANVEVTVASRSAGATGGIALDSCDKTAMIQALRGVDTVVNCVTGSGHAISTGAQVLVDAALEAGMPRIVHLSTMSVYGSQQGVIQEDAPLVDDLGWYGHAKIEAEQQLDRYAKQGGVAIILRPGIIIGPDSEPWVHRFREWIMTSHLADLGPLGDGPANLVDVEDVAQAVAKVVELNTSPNKVETFNLVAPDSPRWNEYFFDLAELNGITLSRWGHKRLQAEVYIRGTPLKVLERLMSKFGTKQKFLPTGIPPSLMNLWKQQILLDCSKATNRLGVRWTPYKKSIEIIRKFSVLNIPA